MNDPIPMTRRRLLKTLFCSSIAMRINAAPPAPGSGPADASTLDLLAIGDFGTGDEAQRAVSRGMMAYAKTLPKPIDGLLLLGDNFYGPMKEGVKSPRWQTGFSDMYPGTVYPGPCWPILGNHDYHDNNGFEIQPAYAASLNRKTRWTMPGKYYRLDLPAVKPQVTLLMIDTNWESINRKIHDDKSCWMPPAETTAQMAWLEAELAKPRAPFTFVVGHHPIYSDGKHGDTTELVNELGPLLEKNGVHLYLCGHDHDLQHLELEKLRTSFAISGGGGARLYENTAPRPGSVVHEVFGFSHISFNNDHFLFRHIDPNGKVVHAFYKNTKFEWKVKA